jgi:hypothetical protein
MLRVVTLDRFRAEMQASVPFRMLIALFLHFSDTDSRPRDFEPEANYCKQVEENPMNLQGPMHDFKFDADQSVANLHVNSVILVVNCPGARSETEEK